MKYLSLIFICIASIARAQVPMNAYQWRNVGPANQGGRIVDIEALDNQFRKVWMATGSGGVWYSENAGTTWTPMFDNYSTASIGDIAVNQQDPFIIWVGSGEANNRNSVSWGDGVFRSTDGGKTFQNIGLNETHQIARVQTLPNNPDAACVCAVGHLWGTSGDRGLFKTVDGGENWEKLTNGLPNDGKTGCTDLVVDPNNTNIMYAAFYERLRKPWHFQSGGDNGGIFKSIDGGKSWNKLSNGLPEGPTGRIGLAIYQKDPNIVMALVEAERTDTLSIPGSGVYRSVDGGESWKYLNTYNNRPFYYSQIRINPSDDQRVYLLTTRFMVSEDGGHTFTNGSQDEEVHGDFHSMWLDPNDPDRYYLGADKGMSLTHDHGNTFQLFDNLPIAQYYRIGLDHQDPYYIYGGLQDNGFYATASFTRDTRGVLNDSNWKVHWGDGQYTATNPDNYRKVFTSAENGSLNLYDPVTHRIDRISPNMMNISNLMDYYNKEELSPRFPIRYNWSAPLVLSPTKALYYAGNHVFKSTNQGKSWTIISQDLSTNDPEKTQYRASGGITPDNSGAETHCTITSLAIDVKDEQLIWAGTDDGQVHVTTNGGAKWSSVRKKIKDVPDGIWVSRILASTHKKGRAYVTFDGHRSDHNAPYIFVTEDYGKSWTPLMTTLPEDLVIRVVIEDVANSNLLFIGTETGVWATIDKGASWFKFMPNMPTVSVYDLAIHPRDRDLVAGSHGRGLFVMDDIHALEQLTSDVIQSELHLFNQPEATIWENVSRGGQRGHFWYGGENPDYIRPTSSLARARFEADVPVYYYVGGTDSVEVQLVIADNSNSMTTSIKAAPGINKFLWDRSLEAKPYSDADQKLVDNVYAKLDTSNSTVKAEVAKYYANRDSIAMVRRMVTNWNDFFQLDPSLGVQQAAAGTYQITLTLRDQRMTRLLIIREDPLLKEDE